MLPLHHSPRLWLQRRESNPHRPSYELGALPLSYAATKGQGGNRTHDFGFADQRLQPLGYLTSSVCCSID